ncbi:ferric reductase like transmembrane component-domain-containing protein [Plectosphaerella plurivora]|uniref:Ferric reductase like transmembrane component-domain-containing protein n=1 Tax=Plectosphaerella plurivora TaxID=936078 RepID=A0A9P9ABB9_9PEZI|nr:ferric reductase like transmembrane component-domain-containing protein [Plectosphaerella plurivora]
MSPVKTSTLAALAAALFAIGAHADGTGLIGYGKTLYNPTCSFACRNVVRKQPLACTPEESTENHGTAHNPVTTPPKCFVQENVFLKTMALCIDTYCPLSGDPPLSLLEDYWASHLGTGTLGNYAHVPVMSYQDALAAAREDEANVGSNSSSSSDTHTGHSMLKPRQHGDHGAAEEDTGLVTFDVSSPLPYTAGGSTPLNTTSFVGPDLWQLQYNYMYDFETNEKGHSTMTIIIAVVAIFLPLFLSFARFIPASRSWSYIQSVFVHPATWGRRHREPVAAAVIPNRGQTLYILLISFLNLILWLAPYVIHQPQASFASLGMQTLSIVGNRAGVMAMGNVVALFLFAGRNNILLHFTDWSHATYLLLHRWLGYWAVFHTIVHSFMLLANYVIQGSYEAELKRLYWIWGIVGTVAVSAMIPSSLLWVRQRFYEFFLASHVVLSLLFIIGYYYHIWYVYTYNWGYEIWIFVAGGIWGIERVVRLARMARHGVKTAIISVVDDEYLRIEIQGNRLEGGVAYLCFPGLSWRFWETHPFSVAHSGPAGGSALPVPTAASNEKVAVASATGETDPEVASNESAPPSPATAGTTTSGDSTIFFARVRDGITKQLAALVHSADGTSSTARLRVVIEGPYHHSGSVASQLAKCPDVICIAGGVGITACLPYLRQSKAASSTKLFWSSRSSGLETALGPALAALPSELQIETVVGRRLELDTILSSALLGKGEGAVAIIVCGPPAMADEVRHKIVTISRTEPLSRPYLLLDEAFGW